MIDTSGKKKKLKIFMNGLIDATAVHISYLILLFLLKTIISIEKDTLQIIKELVSPIPNSNCYYN